MFELSIWADDEICPDLFLDNYVKKASAIS